MSALEQSLQTSSNRARLQTATLPLVPEIALILVDPATQSPPFSHSELTGILANPCYWAMCWASGQVAARYILDHPALVRDKTVVDFGAGSGVAGIAAALAGASRVIACDLDPVSQTACHANASLNRVNLEVCGDYFGLEEPVDVLLAADVLYDTDNFPLLAPFRRRSSMVLIADSRVKHLPDTNFTKLFEAEATTWPDLNEAEEFNRVSLYVYEDLARSLQNRER